MESILFFPKYFSSYRAARGYTSSRYIVAKKDDYIYRGESKFHLCSLSTFNSGLSYLLGHVVSNMEQLKDQFVNNEFYIAANSSVIAAEHQNHALYKHIKLNYVSSEEHGSTITMKAMDVQENEYIIKGNFRGIVSNIQTSVDHYSVVNRGSIIIYQGSPCYLTDVQLSYGDYRFRAFNINTKTFLDWKSCKKDQFTLVEDKTLLEESRKIYNDYIDNFRVSKFLVRFGGYYIIEDGALYTLDFSNQITNKMTVNDLSLYAINNGYNIPTEAQLNAIQKKYDRDQEESKGREDIIKNILEEFHKDNHYLDVRPNNKRALIHFPKVTISNGRQSHDLYDLYIGIELTNNYFVKNIKGLRGNISYAESRANYAHSHLNGTSYYNFCLGGSTVTDLYKILSKKFDADLFEVLVLELDTLAGWESLDGGPHKHMENVFSYEKGDTGEFNSNDNRKIDYLSKKVLNHMKSSYILPKTLIKKTIRKGISYFHTSLKDFSDSLLEQFGFQKVVLQGTREIKADVYRDSSSSTTNREKELLHNHNIIYKGEKLQTFIDYNLGKVSSDDLNKNVKIEFSKKQIERVEQNLNKKII